jgi:hypothetical protein
MSSGGGSFSSLGLYVGSDWTLRCLTYPDRLPILSIDAGECAVTIHAANGTSSEQTAAFARELATAAQRFAQECERMQQAAAGSTDSAGIKAA